MKDELSVTKLTIRAPGESLSQKQCKANAAETSVPYIIFQMYYRQESLSTNKVSCTDREV
jgi:hypothetical protein